MLPQPIVPNEADLHRAEVLYGEFLIALGLFDPHDPEKDMIDTPKRVTKMMLELTTPLPFTATCFDPPRSGSMGREGDLGIVLQRKLDFTSMCSHHIMPFHGLAWVAYIPNQRIIGLSKLARTVDFFSRALQTQELMGTNIADYLMNELQPHGVAVILKAEHTCMSARGVRAHGAETITSTLRGAFFSKPEAREELFQLMSL